ncbi:MAG: (2Fe-2S) ferredoxin domain-containing protein [Melioribacteraceae bacterium]|nr:(2Fe-2S) ferredoxin domain-containing protein [Melioribacteraceae bacterium]
MARFEKHVLICDNHRDPSDKRGCCAAKGSSEILDNFKKRLKELGLTHKMRANKSGCLDACEHGAVVLVYPEQIWYGNVKPEDIEEIIQSHLINNIPVERLMIKDKKFL